MSKDSQLWMESLTGISKAELLINSKHCNPSELNLKFLKREDVIFKPSEFREYNLFYMFTNFRETHRPNMVSYDIYDAIWDNNAKLMWTNRDDTEKRFEKPIVHSRHHYVLMGKDYFKKIDAEFMQKRMLGNFMNWDSLPWEVKS